MHPIWAKTLSGERAERVQITQFPRRSLFPAICLQGRRVAIRGAVSPGAADPVRRLRPPDRREGGRRHQVRPTTLEGTKLNINMY